MKFLLDANFLLIPGKFGVDVFSELEKFGKPELFTLDLVLGELDKIIRRGGRDAKHAMMAIVLVKEKYITVVPGGSTNADDEMAKMAAKDYTVCTQDAGLIERINAKGKKVITLRQKKYLVRK